MERSGAGIAWDYFAPEYYKSYTKYNSRPWLVNIIENRDLWRFEEGDDTSYASAYIASLPMTFDEWDKLEAEGLESAVEKGKIIRKYIDQYSETACKDVVYKEIAGYRIPVINVSYQNCSDHVHRLLEKHPGYPFAASFYLRGDGRWQFSLRSREDFDVSNVAKIFYGGGHAQSAGFEVRELPWNM